MSAANGDLSYAEMWCIQPYWEDLKSVFLEIFFGQNMRLTTWVEIGIFGIFFWQNMRLTKWVDTYSELTSTFNPKERSDWGPKLIEKIDFHLEIT